MYQPIVSCKVEHRPGMSAQGFVYPVGCVAAHRGHPVRVPVEGELHRCMPERLLNIGWVGATSQQQGSVGVPEIVPPYVGQLRSLEQRLEEPVDYVLGVVGGALARGEHEP